MRLTLVGTALGSTSTGETSARYGYATARLEAHLRATVPASVGLEVCRVDLPFDLDRPRLDEEGLERVLATEPDVIGLSCYLWDLDELVRLAELARGRRPSLAVVAGGPSATFEVERLLSEGSPVDIVVRGEGEETLAELATASFDPKGVAGTSWRGARGEVHHEPDRPLISDLDSLASALLGGVLEPPRRNLLFEFSRGCRRRCHYCAWKLRGGAVRRHSRERIAAELRWAVERGYEHGFIIDSSLNGSDDHLLAVTAAAREADPGRSLALSFFLDARDLRPEHVRWLGALRPHEMTIGLETLTREAARVVGRAPVELDALSRSLDELAPLAPATLSIILGLPGDTLEGFQRTIDACARLADKPGSPRIDKVRVFWLLVAPGSRLWRRAQAGELEVNRSGLPYVTASETFPRADLIRAMRRLADHPRADLFLWEDPDPRTILGPEAPALGRGAIPGLRDVLHLLRPLRPGQSVRGFTLASPTVEAGFPVVALLDRAGRVRARLQLRPRGSSPRPYGRTRTFDLLWLPSGPDADRQEAVLVGLLARLVQRNDA